MMESARYRCHDEARRRALQEQSLPRQLNGIDYLEVASPDQRRRPARSEKSCPCSCRTVAVTGSIVRTNSTSPLGSEVGTSTRR